MVCLAYHLFVGRSIQGFLVELAYHENNRIQKTPVSRPSIKFLAPTSDSRLARWLAIDASALNRTPRLGRTNHNCICPARHSLAAKQIQSAAFSGWLNWWDQTRSRFFRQASWTFVMNKLFIISAENPQSSNGHWNIHGIWLGYTLSAFREGSRGV
jgi:hypothetical protein